MKLTSIGLVSTGDQLYHPNSYGMAPHMGSSAGSMTDAFNGGWTIPFGSLATEFTMTTGTAYASRSTEQQELLTAMNRQVQHFQPGSIQVKRYTLPSGRENNYAGAYQQIRSHFGGIITSACFIKRISGNMPTSNWCNGYNTSTGGWQLCGDHYHGASTGYTHNHPYGAGTDSACVFLVALPAVVYGYVNLDNNRNWWPFPQGAGSAAG